MTGPTRRHKSKGGVVNNGCDRRTRHNSNQMALLSYDSPTRWLVKICTKSTLRPALVFAHFDDAPLSAFSVLADTRFDALNIVVCGGKPQNQEPGVWDRQCGFSCSNHAFTHRLQEYEAVNREVRCGSITLDIVDGQYQTGQPDRWDQARRKATVLIRRHRSNVIITHGWRSEHPDHRLVVDLASKVSEELQIPLILTCDRPYFSCSGGQCRSLASRKTTSLTCSFFLHDSDWTTKIRSIALFGSQHSALSAAFGEGWCDEAHLRYECYSLAFLNRGRAI
jgi:LmbE family N-acetylglucosaminyl deacetylase